MKTTLQVLMKFWSKSFLPSRLIDFASEHSFKTMMNFQKKLNLIVTSDELQRFYVYYLNDYYWPFIPCTSLKLGWFA